MFLENFIFNETVFKSFKNSWEKQVLGTSETNPYEALSQGEQFALSIQGKRGTKIS